MSSSLTTTNIARLPAQTGQGDMPTESLTYNLEAEQALLGALLLNNPGLEQVSDYLRPEHFADQIHGRIYDAIVRLVDRGQIADPITLRDFFDKDKTKINEFTPRHYKLWHLNKPTSAHYANSWRFFKVPITEEL